MICCRWDRVRRPKTQQPPGDLAPHGDRQPASAEPSQFGFVGQIVVHNHAKRKFCFWANVLKGPLVFR